MKSNHYKYAVVYIDGGNRTKDDVPGIGVGVHGYFFNELPSLRFRKIDALVTPEGYKPKLTGPQLKDAKYNPTYAKWDISKAVKDNPVFKDEVDITLLDGMFGYSEGSNNTAEMDALISLMTKAPLTADKYLIYSDSELLVLGYNDRVKKWAERNWTLSTGTPVKNLDRWQTIYEHKPEWDTKIDLQWIKAHNGDFGNERADRNATYGVIAGINQNFEHNWITTNLMDADYWEPAKPIPNILRTKWNAVLTGSERPVIKYNGADHYQYLAIDMPDEIKLIGRQFSDSLFGCVWHKENNELLNRIVKYHTDNMWTKECETYRSDVIQLCNVSNITTPKSLWELNNVPLSSMWWEDDRNTIVSEVGGVISEAIRPPALSYRILDEEELLTRVMSAYCEEMNIERPSNIEPVKKVVFTDLTDYFYTDDIDKSGKSKGLKLTDNIDQITRSITVKVPQPCNDKVVPVTMSINIHIPTRNVFNALAKDEPSVHVATWWFDKRAFKFALIIKTDDYLSIWTNPYANLRILDNAEFK